MRLLFLGDIFGRSGRTAIAERLPKLRDALRVDFVVANSENATHGLGLSPPHARLLLSSGVDCITLGDHAFDQRNLIPYIEKETRILRPVNYARKAPGHGSYIYGVSGERRILVVAALGRIFMSRPAPDPFEMVDDILKTFRLGTTVDAIVIDMHGEATSEKNAMGHWCDGRASLVAGTHTHIPTADDRVLGKGTAYITDAGMCGDYASVIGMEKELPLRRFVTGMPGPRFQPAKGEATLSGVFVETDPQTGLARSITRILDGGTLAAKDSG